MTVYKGNVTAEHKNMRWETGTHGIDILWSCFCTWWMMTDLCTMGRCP